MFTLRDGLCQKLFSKISFEQEYKKIAVLKVGDQFKNLYCLLYTWENGES